MREFKISFEYNETYKKSNLCSRLLPNLPRVFLPAACMLACFQISALPQLPLNINWWGNEKHIPGNCHGGQRERAYLRNKWFPWAFNFHAKATGENRGEIIFSVNLVHLKNLKGQEFCQQCPGAHDSQKHAQTQDLESLDSKIAEILICTLFLACSPKQFRRLTF